MATKSKAPKAKAPKEVKLSAPKIATAWNNVCTTSTKSENEIVKAIENLSAVMVLESRLSIADQKKFIKGLEDSGKTSSFVKSSQAPALATWSKLRALHKDFTALPIAKQLSVATASYNLLGSGKGEQIKTLDALTTEIARERKNKNDKAKGEKSAPKAKKSATIADTLRAAIALVNSIGDGVEEDVYDLLLELAEAAAIKVGADA
jgi:hypothetical protein